MIGAAKFPEHNIILRGNPAAGVEDLLAHAYPELQIEGHPEDSHAGGFISRWELTERERAAIAAGGPIWIYVVGNRQPPPPIAATAITPFADHSGPEQCTSAAWEADHAGHGPIEMTKLPGGDLVLTCMGCASTWCGPLEAMMEAAREPREMPWQGGPPASPGTKP